MPISSKSIVIFSALITFFLVGCNKRDDMPAIPVSEESLYTNDSILVQDLTVYTGQPVIRDEFHLLGYGYDVTGEYADTVFARKQVVDIAKLNAAWPYSVVKGRSTSSSAFNAAAKDAAALAHAISGQTEDHRFSGLEVQEQDSKIYYRKEISNYFPNSDAYSSKYIYGRQCIELMNRILYFNWGVDGFLTPSFVSDIDTYTPAQLIEKYGTHVLTRINMGAKLNILYQSETVQKDREEAAELGFSVALAKTFSSFSGYLDFWGKQSAPGNFSQKVAFKATGGDVSHIKTIVDSKTGITKIDYSEWVKSTSGTSPEIIDIQEIVPVYHFIKDPVKKSEVQKYFDEYLVKNAPVTN